MFGRQDRPEHLLTPLHVAARMGHARVVEVLIETGAQYDTRRLLRNGGSSPLRDAIQRCHVEVVKLLVQKDATVPRKALFEFNNEARICATNGNAKAWQRAIGMFGLLEGPQGLQLNIFHCSAFVTALQQNWQGAAALVQRMGFLGISQILGLNVFSCGAMMEACTASAWQLSLSTLKWMLKTRLSPDEFGADTRLAASRRAGWQSAMVALTINASTLNIALGNVGLGLSLTTLEKAVQWLHALDLLDTFARKALRYNVINTNSLISCLEKVGYWRQALPLLFRMGQVNLLPDTVSCSATVSACEEQGRWREAAHLSSKQGNSLMVFAGAVSASEKALRWPRALQVLSMMPQLRLTADLVTFNATLRALERGLCWQMVLEVFEDMPKARTEAKLPGAAWHVLQIMEEASIETNVFHYSAAINACEKAGEWMLALAVVVGMQEKEVMPNTPPDMETEAFVAQLSRELGFSLYTASRLDYPTSGALPVAFGEGSVDWLEVTIAAVAEGLTQASKQAVKGCLLPVEWLGMFLRTPGHAPAHILNAIFQSHSLKYFDFENQRQDANMAHFENSSYLNVKEGMPFEETVSRHQYATRISRGQFNKTWKR
eukprot:g20574.t1